MNNTVAQPYKLKGFGLVRDKYGNPKVDDARLLTPEVLAMLTEDDIQYLKENDKWL